MNQIKPHLETFSHTATVTEQAAFCHTLSPEMLRDWFAGQALNGYLRDEDHDGAVADYESIAETAYALADAMLEARKR